MIPYSTQTIDESDLNAVSEILRSPFLTTGPAVTEFEEAVAGYCGASFAVAVNSCTSALHVAMLALGTGPGDIVWVSGISFTASANCARYCGAEVDFLDVDAHTGNLDLDKFEEKLKKAETNGTLPKAVVAVHLSGRPLDLLRLDALRKKYGFKLVEDAAHATGALYQSEKIGSCKYSDIAVMSFHPVKIITTAEGGMALTNDKDLAERMRLFSNHGIIHDKERLSDKNRPAYYYEQQFLGYNYRLNDIQAALGLSQLRRVEDFLKKRRALARSYAELFEGCDKLRLPVPDSEDNVSSWHLYQVQILNGRRDEVYEKMRARKIGVQIHYFPIHLQPYYQVMLRENKIVKHYDNLDGAVSFFEKTLTLPLYPNLKTLDQQMTAAALMSILDRM